MNLTIGENIRKLRMKKGLTQEQLSAVLGVSCAAVSKWERGETYPDMTLLFPLAHFFGVSCDELLGYEQEKMEREIEGIVERYFDLYYSDHAESLRLIREAHKTYPNDYRITNCYMDGMIGGAADNDPRILRENREELMSLCDSIIDGCEEEYLRLNAWNIKAKILHAEGKTEQALEIYRKRFSNWYQSGDQKIEQLFAKDTPEFLDQVRLNLYALADFAADKLSKSIFFDPAVPKEEALRRIEECGDLLEEAGVKTQNAAFTVAACSLFRRLHNDMRNYVRVGSEEDYARIGEKIRRNDGILHEFAKTDAVLERAL